MIKHSSLPVTKWDRRLPLQFVARQFSVVERDSYYYLVQWSITAKGRRDFFLYNF